MTAPELLVTCREAGIELAANGDRLRLNAPRGAVTPELRAQLKECKAEILPLLATPRFVALAPTELTLPRAVVDFAMDLERRGFTLTVSQSEIDVHPAKALTPADQAALARWRSHLVALTEFCDRVVV